MRKTILAALVGIYWAIGLGPLVAVQLKKVLVLDFKNVLKKKDFDYLEASITDAVRNKLKEKFAFKELPKEQWQEVAKENFIAEEDVYTYSAAINIGLAARQDIVIFGGFIAENKKGGAQEIATRVRILDLSKKKQIADFELRNPVDATIFDVVDQIANRIVKEAAAVLPSKDDMARGRFREEIPTLNQLSLRGQFAPLAFSANQTVSAAGQHAGTDFSKVAAVALDFHHFGIFKEQLGVFIGGIVRSASNEFRYAIDGSVVPVSLQSFVGQGGIAWRQKLTPKFYLQPFLGGGVQYDTMKFNYDSQTVAVSNTTGQPLSAREYALFSPFACAGLRFGYAINSWLMLETGALYAMSFFQGATGQSLFAELGVGFRL